MDSCQMNSRVSQIFKRSSRPGTSGGEAGGHQSRPKIAFRYLAGRHGDISTAATTEHRRVPAASDEVHSGAFGRNLRKTTGCGRCMPPGASSRARRDAGHAGSTFVLPCQGPGATSIIDGMVELAKADTAAAEHLAPHPHAHGGFRDSDGKSWACKHIFSVYCQQRSYMKDGAWLRTTAMQPPLARTRGQNGDSLAAIGPRSFLNPGIPHRHPSLIDNNMKKFLVGGSFSKGQLHFVDIFKLEDYYSPSWHLLL
ncbi:unnamed protein product [Urochloa humidicola]